MVSEAAEAKAEELGVDVDEVTGTGADGNVTVKDVERHARGEEAPAGDRDASDLGVPMLPGSGDEPQGPEDALGPGPKRGDYSERVGGSDYQPHEVVATDDGVEVNAQRPRASDQGEEPGVKGGVDTA